jgi:hypothetical protein
MDDWYRLGTKRWMVFIEAWLVVIAALALAVAYVLSLDTPSQ